LQHWAGVRFYTSFNNLAKSYVFIKQSPLPFFLKLIAPLIPKLRGQFAEFLQHYYPLRFNLLNIFTCVRVGTIYWLYFSRLYKT